MELPVLLRNSSSGFSSCKCCICKISMRTGRTINTQRMVTTLHEQQHICSRTCTEIREQLLYGVTFYLGKEQSATTSNLNSQICCHIVLLYLNIKCAHTHTYAHAPHTCTQAHTHAQTCMYTHSHKIKAF